MENKDKYLIGIDYPGDSLPGSKAKPFLLKFEDSFFQKGNILNSGLPNVQLRIIKVYKFNWYRKLLHFFGFKFKMFNCVKVENYGK